VTASIGFESIAAGAITLRPWEPPDVSFVYDACQDPDIQRWTNLPSPFTASDAIALLHLSSSLREEGKAALFAIASTDQGELFGAVSVREVDHRRRQALIGYWVALEARRRGAATHAVAALSPWAMETLDLDEVADVLGNGDVVRVLRCGARTARAAARSAALRSRRPATCSTKLPRSASTTVQRNVRFDSCQRRKSTPADIDPRRCSPPVAGAKSRPTCGDGGVRCSLSRLARRSASTGG
jgi:hypothetical protein